MRRDVGTADGYPRALNAQLEDNTSGASMMGTGKPSQSAKVLAETCARRGVRDAADQTLEFGLDRTHYGIGDAGRERERDTW
jgi:hypothetical protein